MKPREGVSAVAAVVVVVLIVVIAGAGIYLGTRTSTSTSVTTSVTTTSTTASSSSSSTSSTTSSSSVATSSTSSSSSSSGGPLNFTALLTGAPGVTTSATGEANFQVSANNQSITYQLNVGNIDNVFMAHIHLSPSMDIVVWLDPTPDSVASGAEAACLAVLSTPPGPIASCPGYISGSFSGVLAAGTITAADLSGNTTCAGCSGLSSPTMSALVAAIESGQTFVNVHTMQNPGGEIQGTILPQSAVTNIYVGGLPSAVGASMTFNATTKASGAPRADARAIPT